jgi:hypothetical protein
LYFVIKNDKNVYITLNKNGQPNPCTENDKGKFDKVKAQNILNSLPKTMKRMGFKLECVPDVIVQTPIQKIVKEESKKIIENTDYHPSENITQWVNKFGQCSDIIKEAKSRYEELEKQLHISDQELIDVLHNIELELPKDLYSAWLLYKKIRENRRNRRQLKDEMLIIHNVLKEIDDTKISRERTQKAIDGLFDRKYTYRVVEVDENVV